VTLVLLLILTGSWGDRTVRVVHIRIVQVTVCIDSKYISITVEIVRRERPKSLGSKLTQELTLNKAKEMQSEY